MPGRTSDYEVLLDFRNDTADSATVQLAKDYGQSTGSTVLLRPGETVTLVLDAGMSYRYALKTRAKVANVTAQAWRDVRVEMSRLFPAGSGAWPPSIPAGTLVANGVTIDKLWKDIRFTMFYDA